MTLGINAFYILQLLEDTDGSKYHVFKKWGRVGTKMGSSQTKDFDSLSAAKKHFEKTYYEKTHNKWGDEEFEKQPGKYYPIDVDHDVDKNEELRKLTGAGEKRSALVSDERVQVRKSLLRDLSFRFPPSLVVTRLAIGSY